MKIKLLKVDANFKYLWLKTVDDVNLNLHCAKCLIGEYDSRIKTTKQITKDLLLENKVYYLCGVAFPFNWNNNFHLAFKPSKDKNITYSNNGITVEIEGAEQLPISPKYNRHQKLIYKSYSTCRCWQFANWFNDNLK